MSRFALSLPTLQAQPLIPIHSRLLWDLLRGRKETALLPRVKCALMKQERETYLAPVKMTQKAGEALKALEGLHSEARRGEGRGEETEPPAPRPQAGRD